jgi:hypothetical protein
MKRLTTSGIWERRFNYWRRRGMSGKVNPQFRICAVANDDSEIDVPVCLYGTEHQIWVRPGDIIVGDADGVVCCPRFLVENVLALLPQLTKGLLTLF